MAALLRPARALASACAALALLVGCAEPDPMPYGITSLAVLPAEVSPPSADAGRLIGEYLTVRLLDTTPFRVVGADSARRIVSQPDTEPLYQRFRSQLKGGLLTFELARAMADRVGCQGLVVTRLASGLAGATGGTVTLSVAVYEGSSGNRVWSGFRQRSYQADTRVTGYNRTVADLVGEIVDQMPRPAGGAP